ncbi:bifunctional UDP-N-acetylglucosamine diphosphorylase/glucosamine-1-phosphate N-acetyltransferase GlmU [Geminicoccaceae bacterium 1502E]|nr:bifunctional UDP-N-acetylglucosamine diphosphorylase/glucosamine-1-phosphate N-acetyltransferase GlmU [Geminicoccaceae bacterium 1502E]
MTEQLSVVVLAAGKGTRMKNGLAKVLHPLAARPLIAHVLGVAGELGAGRLVVVLGPNMEEVRSEVERCAPDARFAIQDPPLGTGHALQAALDELPARGTVLVLYGDTPLITAPTLSALVERRRESGAAVSVLGMAPPDPGGYGRLRFEGEELAELVEERHADEHLKRAALCNSGVMAFDAARLRELLEALPLRRDKNEYYLTDAVALARQRGWSCRAAEGPWQEGLGINSQGQLAAAEAIFQQRRRHALLEAGVVMRAPETVHLAADTVIEPGAFIEPYVVFGPGVRVEAGAVVHSFSHLEEASLAAGANVGPFARLRPGSRLEEGAKVGNFVELKNATLEAGAKVNHLSYVGDASVGRRANVGAGTITCNYDGFGKHRTDIGEGAFIGSNSALVAPVRVGRGAIVGAGSTIVHNVPDDAVAIARTAQAIKEGRAPRMREQLKRRKEQQS